MRGDRRNRVSPAETAANTAKEAAATAFYDMDQAERYLRGRLTVFADLDKAAAAPAEREFAALGEAATAASASYIAVVDAHPFDGRPRSPAEWDGVARAFRAVTDRMTEMNARLERFGSTIAASLSRLEAALDRLPPRLTAARDATAAAEAAVAAARDAGLDASAEEAELAAVRADLARLGSAGLGGLGLDGALTAAEDVARRAAAVREAAEDLPKEAERTRNALASVRTRVEVVAGRSGPVRDAMRTLLREYAEGCWRDLKGAPEAIEAGVARARERLDEAAGQVAAARWRDAQRSLTAARTELNAADRRAGQVTGRVAELAAVAADPEGAAETARFAVRDAQRLAMAQPGGAAPHHARVLDGLVERLERAPSGLRGAHPDYWAYLTELEAVRTAAGDVVARIRSERAGQH
ncbi:molecular chaperone DnaJ [Actinomadura rayongensis]|uniref:molecular chaperone DnaJ n=1 Tax=Actinomadura rayongensis TaxID=1429076 RepID=UPI001F182395|nr:molecular chaperone DnaJ [Actinomadura rayongensis]